jgi:hypothetical protein
LEAVNLKKPLDLRRTERVPALQPISISWDDGHGEPKFAIAKGSNICENGVGLRVNEPLPLRSFVSLHSESLRLSGTAAVRYCLRGNGCYSVGLEFSGGMKYKIPSGS